MFVSSLLAEGLKDGLRANHAHFLPKHELCNHVSYLFDVRSIALQRLLDLATEQLRRSHTQLLAFLTVDPQQLLRGVVVVLDLFLRSHR